MTAVLVSAKVSVFYSKFNKTFPKSSQRFYLEQTLIKTQNHIQTEGRWVIYSLTEEKTQKTKKIKIGLPPNKRYRLTPLARHKSEDRSRYCHLWKAILQ